MATRIGDLNFCIFVPAKELQASRIMATLDSILRQGECLSPSCSVTIVVVTSVTASRSNVLQVPLPANFNLTFVHDEGTGLYAALGSAFSKHCGDVNGYLGQGDTLEAGALSILAQVFSRDQAFRPKWVTGMIVGRRADGAAVRVTMPPKLHSRGFLRGVYGRLLPSIQQESTFWSADLHRIIDRSAMSAYRLAGDYFLWREFSKLHPPLVLEAMLGSFHWHGDNMSSDWTGYVLEMDEMCGRLSRVDHLWAHQQRIIWGLPTRLKVARGYPWVQRYRWPDGPWGSTT